MSDELQDKFALMVVEALIKGSIMQFHRLLRLQTRLADLLERDIDEISLSEQQIEDIEKIITSCVGGGLSSLFAKLDRPSDDFSELKIIVDGKDITTDRLQVQLFGESGWIERSKSTQKDAKIPRYQGSYPK
jgi:hypothetical protein